MWRIVFDFDNTKVQDNYYTATQTYGVWWNITLHYIKQQGVFITYFRARMTQSLLDKVLHLLLNFIWFTVNCQIIDILKLNKSLTPVVEFYMIYCKL